ncbi:MAG: hypothetical protein V2J16_07470 [Thermoleophilia bacterium]|nr:hypothetical protein [Thermoleophilia bacterium]
MSSYAVALLLLTALILVGGWVSAVRLQAKPPAIGWVLAGFAVLAVTVAEPSYYVYLTEGGALDFAPFAFWLGTLTFLAALLGTGYAIAAQKWGRSEYGPAVMGGFVVVFLFYGMSVVLRLLIMR